MSATLTGFQAGPFFHCQGKIMYQYFTLTDANGAILQEGICRHDIKPVVEHLANGKPWGWRAAPDGSMEAVCDFAVIAVAVPLEL